MDLGIKELGITLMVGAFTLIAVQVILRLLFNKSMFDFFSWLAKEEGDTVYNGFSRFDPRLSVLINEKHVEPADSPLQWWLAKDLSRTNSFLLADPINGAGVQKWFLNPCRCRPDSVVPECPSTVAIDDSISKLFYLAKNRVYANQNY